MSSPCSSRPLGALFLLGALLGALSPGLDPRQAHAEPARQPEPQSARAQVYAAHRAHLERWRSSEEVASQLERDPALLERRLVREMYGVFEHWFGTRWGRGAPQTRTPSQGKINCGMFVGRTLVDAGFELDHVKLQRQPAELIIESLAPTDRIRRWRHAPMARFLEDVRRMGPGLYIIGLDFHVGYLMVRPDEQVRFIHASYVTYTVIDEPAAEAIPIRTSDYRVVGKILQPGMLRAWVAGERIPVRGDW